MNLPPVKPDNRLLTVEEVCQRWTVASQTLANWRSDGGGPAFVKIGSRVRYRESDLIAYENEHRII